MIAFLEALGQPHNGMLGGLTLIVMFLVAVQVCYKFGKFWVGEIQSWYKSKQIKDNKLAAVDAVKEDNNKQNERLQHIEENLRVNDFEHRIPRLEDDEKAILSKMNDIESCVSAMTEVI